MLSFMSPLRGLSVISRSWPNTCTNAHGTLQRDRKRPEHSTLDACTADDVKFGVTDPPDCCDFFLKAGNTRLDLR
jgi:hypothetical protein